MRRTLATLLFTLAAGLAVASPAAAQAPACDPFQTTPEFRGQVPEPPPGTGPQNEVSIEDSDAYLTAVDDASDRVISSTLGRSVQDRPIRYAIVGRRRNVTADGLATIRQSAARLQNPHTPAREVSRIVNRSPATLWIAGNVHGGEESGLDASLRTLYELADRRDCAATNILDDSIVVIVPSQNPDGRVADTRQNAYGFDLNRDWFARTQPETDSKLELLRRYPPQLFIDDHEMGAQTFFFPPNADPIYHEITDQSVDWINNIYGPAIQAEFGRQGIDYFNYDIYDLFYMGYGDTVPTTGFGAAGMTFEKNNAEPMPVRAYEQYVSQWTSLSAAVAEKQRILSDWRVQWLTALRQGEDGYLEPNEVVQPTNTVQFEVPDITVRNYFIRDDDPDKKREVQALVRRLQRMDVRVLKLRAPLEVPDFKAYGRPAVATTLPAGTYWIPMAQRQKHWVQAMLNESTYVPFPYFYDVTAWSQPLLFNVEGGYSGRQLRPSAFSLGLADQPAGPELPDELPRVGIFQLSNSTAWIESSGWLRHTMDNVWGVDYEVVTAQDVIGGGLADFDVVILPNGSASTATTALGAAGAAAMSTWLNAGGRLVAYRGGTRLAAGLGLTTATVAEPTSDIPGSLIRARVDESSPLAEGVGAFDYLMYEYDPVLRGSTTATPVVSYPNDPGTVDGDFFISGFADGEEELAGTAAVIDEAVGEGRVIAFGSDPNYRAFTDGSGKLLFNAVLGADPAAPAAAPAAGSAERAAGEAQAAQSAAAVKGTSDDVRLTVQAASAAKAERVLKSVGARYTASRAGGEVRYLIANPAAKAGDEYPAARELAQGLRRAKVGVVALKAG